MSNLWLIGIFITILIFIGWLFLNKNKISIWPKMFFTVIFTVISIGIFSSFESYKGYATTDLPETGMVMDIMMNNNVVYIWVLKEENKEKHFYDFILYGFDRKDEPRAYAIKNVTKEELEKWIDAKNKLSKGYIVKFNGTKRNKTKGNGSDQIIVPELEVTNPQSLLTKD